MALGGYQIIDFKGIELGETAVTIPDAYAKCATGKAILAENIVLGEGSDPVSGFVISALSEDGYTLTFLIAGVHSVVVTITDEDAVTAAVIQLAESE